MATIETRRARDGTTSFRVKIRLRGHPPASASFSRRTDAKRWVQQTEAAIRDGRYFRTSEARRHTLAELIDRYEREVLPARPKNAKNVKRHLHWWRTKIGAYTLADVSPSVIVECRNALLETKTRRNRPMSPATVVRYMAALSHAFTVAVKEWQWVDDNPFRKVSKPREPRGRERFLSEEERKRLFAACKASAHPWLHPVVTLAVSTGMRRGEILNLRWAQVDLKARRVILHETKNRSSRSVPLRGLALTVITELAKVRRIDTDLLFYGTNPAKPFALDNHWRAAMKAANLKDFRFHDLRHTAASYLAMNGASTIEIAAVLGHKTLQMVQRYSHLTASHAEAVVEAMNEKIFAEVAHGGS